MKIGKTIFAVAALVIFYSLAVALPPDMMGAKVSKPSESWLQDTETMIDVNNLQMFVTNIGSFAMDLGLLLETAKNDGLYFPAGTEKTCIFSAGIWVGGKVNDEIRLAIGAYETPEYVPGPADENGQAQTDIERYKVYKIRKDSSSWNNPSKSGIETSSGIPYLRLDSIRHYDDWQAWKDEAVLDGAPLDTLGNPLLSGDQTLWAVYNDGGEHGYSSYGGATASLGVELQSTFFGFDLPGALGNTIFIKWIVINKSSDMIDSAYIAIWADPDVGDASDDLVGCDTALSMGYAYNGTNTDSKYSSEPPAVGFDFMQGPIVPSPGDTAVFNTGEIIPDYKILGMTSFNKYINGTDPSTTEQAWAYLKGLNGAATGYPPYADPDTHAETRFFAAGDPVKGTGWIDGTPADRRLMLGTGPFTLSPDDTQSVVAALVVGQGKDRLSSVSAMKFYDILAQYAFDVNFNIPSPPTRPVVTAKAYDRKVVLTWDDRSETDYTEKHHQFEGYVVYQGETVAGPWTAIATYDIKNGEGMLKDFVLDQNLGDVVYEPVVYGSDAGLSYGIEITADKILGTSLYNGKDYYFAVTAYSYDYTDANDYKINPGKDDSLFIIPKGLWYLENRQQAITVTPMDWLAGNDYSAAAAPVLQRRIDTDILQTTDVVIPYIIDPEEVTGHVYKVTICDIYPDTVDGVPIWPDTTDVLVDGKLINFYNYWEVWDTTLGTRIIAQQYNKSDNEDYPIVDGIQWVYKGKYVPDGLSDVRYVNNNTTNPDPFTAHVDWLMPFFGGDAGYGTDFFGSSLLAPSALIDSGFIDSISYYYKTVEIRFSHTDTQKAYNYLRGANRKDSTLANYAYMDYYTVPFQVWDTKNNRQLNAAFVENYQSSTYDSTWDPGTTADAGNREYLFILASDYDSLPDPYYTSRNINASPDEFDIMYTLATGIDGGVIDDGDVLLFEMPNPAITNDYWLVPTVAPVMGDKELAKSTLNDIRVVPNPYYAFSVYESGPFDRQVRFLGLPDDFTIRIFNLAGDKIRTLKSTAKTPGDSWMAWDLQTDRGLPVAAGIYIWYLDAPGIGTKYGKMAIFPEVEQLNTY
jgi:hypothetical protein